jgi:Fe-S-cluster-containing dehydrogenase component
MSEKYGTLIPTGRLLDGKPRSILFDATKCIGCRQCVHACKDWHDHPRTSVYEISGTNWITMEPPVLEGLSPFWGRNSCMHCDFPMCAAVCPVEAITKNEEGPVVIDQKACIGCEYCVYACPWGVISQNSVTKKAEKCTMCSDRIREDKNPFCVQGTQLVYVLKEKKEKYGVRSIGPEKYPKHRIPIALMIKDLFTPRCGISGKIRALVLAVIHPKRLRYRYWLWRKEV